ANVLRSRGTGWRDVTAFSAVILIIIFTFDDVGPRCSDHERELVTIHRRNALNPTVVLRVELEKLGCLLHSRGRHLFPSNGRHLHMPEFVPGERWRRGKRASEYYDADVPTICNHESSPLVFRPILRQIKLASNRGLSKTSLLFLSRTHLFSVLFEFWFAR